jgi:hypothetical protein
MITASSDPSYHGQENTRRSFKHESLDRTKDSFRLIKVLPSRSADGLLQLSLWHDVVSSASYRCLSYRWGEQYRRHVVLVNGKELHVGENLHCFLEEMYTSNQNQDSIDSDEALWIDSICINQQCAKERGHQVQHMGSIYTNAREVLVWLGQQNISRRPLYDWVQAKQWTECPEALRDQWDKIRFNPYWYRAWIVQEILLARNITIILPGVRFEYALLGRAIARSTNLDRIEEESAAQLWTFWDDRWRKPQHRNHEPKTVDWIRHQRDRDEFWALIHMHKGAKCADKRDRIYSLLGLISGNHNFKVDYDESITDLFWRAGEHFDAWEAPELVDILRVALLEDQAPKEGVKKAKNRGISPWILVDSLKTRPDFQVRIPIRRASPATSLFNRVTKRITCKFKDCRRAPSLHCTRNDILLCTNAPSSGPTEHGCIHGLAYPIDKPAAEPFEIKIEAHHGKLLANTILPPTALQVLDTGTDSWVGVSTWSSLQKALDKKDLDRADRVKLQVPAKYAIWIWFGVHPDQLDSAFTEHHPELPSAHHALPPGTKVTRNSIEVPFKAIDLDGDVHNRREGIFD